MTAMRYSGWSGAWLGVALIAMGLFFLVQNYLGYQLRNWWALFILIPAYGSFIAAWHSWRSRAGAYAAAGSLTMGILFTAVAAIFLLDLPWGRVWPVFIILAGIGMLLPALVTRRRDET
jgi:hypothetical protein